MANAGIDRDESMARVGGVIARAAFVPASSPLDVDITGRFLEDVAVFDLAIGASVHRWFMPWESRHIHFGQVWSGRFEIWCGGVAREYGPGQSYVFPRWAWVRVRFLEPTVLTHVALRQRAVRNRGVTITDSTLRDVVSSPLTEFAFSVFRSALAAPAGAAADTAIGPTVLSAALGVVLEMDGVADRPDVLEQLRKEAIAIIDEQFSNAELYPEVIARRLGVSLRQLQRAFSAGGISVARRLRNRRLEHAVQMLGSSAMRALSVKQIAHRSGFATAYALRTAVEAQYGMSPTELRAHLAAGRSL